MSTPRTARHVRLQPDSVLARRRGLGAPPPSRRRSAIVAAAIGQSVRIRVPVVGPPNRVCGPGSRSPGIVPLGTPQAGPEWPPAGAVGRQAPVSELIPPSSFIRRRSAASAFSVWRSVAWSSSISCPRSNKWPTCWRSPRFHAMRDADRATVRSSTRALRRAQPGRSAWRGSLQSIHRGRR